MQKNSAASTLVIVTALLAAVASARAQSPFTLRYSLFDPGTNVQTEALQGTSVALDENTLVVGAPVKDYGSTFGVANIYDAAGAPLYTLLDPGPNCCDHFGFAVAVSGRRVVVSAPSSDQGLYPGHVYVYDIAGAAPTVPVMILANPAPPAHGGDKFGYSIAISGTRLVIGMPYSWGPPGNTGRVFVYDLVGATPGVPVATLENPSPSSGFGFAVAISGTRVLAGGNTGNAYLYDLASATPNTPVATLNNPSGGANGYYGYALAIEGTRAVIGGAQTYLYDVASATPTAPTAVLSVAGSRLAISGARLSVGSSGNVYVYDLEGANPSQAIATLNMTTANGFGSSVAISGARVLVGSPLDNTEGYLAGNAFLYDLNNAAPTVPITKLTNPRPGADSFGAYMAAERTLVIVGAISDGGGPTPAGQAYVYDLASATPALPVATVTNPAPSQGGFGWGVAISGTLGVIGGSGTYVYDLTRLNPPEPIATFTNTPWSLAISGTRVIIGAPDEDSGATFSGKVYIYDLARSNSSVPVLILNNPSPGPQIGDDFGTSVAISATRVVVGAPYDDSVAVDAGRVYVYDLSSPAPALPIFTLNDPAAGEADYFGFSVAISGSHLVIGAYQGKTNSGSAYVYDLGGATPTVPVVKLENPSPGVNDNFGNFVTISGTLVAVRGQGIGSVGAPGIYVYDISRPNPGVAIATLPYSPWSTAISGRTVFVGASSTHGPDLPRGAVYVFSPTEPGLTITPASPNSATISWTPVSWPDFVLQYSDSLAPDGWVNVPSGAANPITVSSTNAARFYRLFSP